MEPRELWERHAVLAVAFCGSDDQVRDAQGVLDEAQAARTRMLAAFAVTVGSDGAVADLLGLTEREVRLARRTVGKDDARTVAECLLTVEPGDPPATTEVRETPAGPPEDGRTDRPAQQGPPVQPERAAQQGPPHPAQPPQPAALPAADSAWSIALDAVLVGGWHTGLDLTALAAEFGLELSQLVARAQKLSAEGRLNQPTPHEDRAGRHRRLDGTPMDQGTHSPGGSTAQGVPYPRPNDDVSWQQAPPHTPPWDNTTTAHMDWNGIMNHWNAASQAPSWEPPVRYH
ncbi:hypothetical protein ACIOEX_12160 [Streptomyces sp. NPDC087850]|uniref:hypothetical protein n=1 Tax=Streptomyces sp. NPDC087850 TaxID=3365809 RepID=UPI00381F0006